MLRLTLFLNHCRQSSRLIQSVALVFMLSLGMATAAPWVQAHNYSPDLQTVCLGNGGMAVVTFTADGTPQQTPADHGLNCPLCLTLQAPVLTLNQTVSALAVPAGTPFTWISVIYLASFEDRSPPARAPPLES